MQSILELLITYRTEGVWSRLLLYVHWTSYLNKSPEPQESKDRSTVQLTARARIAKS